MFKHDFLAICKKGHKRNFIYDSDTNNELKNVLESCIYCNKIVEFKNLKYWSEIIKIGTCNNV